MTDQQTPGAGPQDAASLVPSAQHQTSLRPEQLLHSTNAGVIVERTGMVRNGFRSEGRKFARELAEYINNAQVGVATVFVYEETFGQKDRIHWLIHMRSLADYDTLVNMGSSDEGFREIFYRNQISPDKGGGTWDQMFLDGSLQETVLLPQFWRMYGTAADAKPDFGPGQGGGRGGVMSLPPARHQCDLPDDQILHSANAGILIHRSAELRYEFRSEGRQFAREVVESINSKQVGVATAFLFEEAFGVADRIHWLIHMRSLDAYYTLLEMHVRDEDVRDIYFRQRIPDEQGGGNWSRMFVQGTMVDTALTPQHWGMYATRK